MNTCLCPFYCTPKGARFNALTLYHFSVLKCRNNDKKYALNRAGDSLEDYISDSFEKWCGASVGISINLKDGAVYPKAIMIYEEGKEFNPFADFDEEELPFK